MYIHHLFHYENNQDILGSQSKAGPVSLQVDVTGQFSPLGMALSLLSSDFPLQTSQTSWGPSEVLEMPQLP